MRISVPRLGSVGGAPTFEIAHRYLSKAPVAFGNDAKRGGFNVIDLRASIGLSENLRIMAFANNLFDKFGILNEILANRVIRTYGGMSDTMTVALSASVAIISSRRGLSVGGEMARFSNCSGGA